jgi:anti-sigma B factor antagonist
MSVDVSVDVCSRDGTWMPDVDRRHPVISPVSRKPPGRVEWVRAVASIIPSRYNVVLFRREQTYGGVSPVISDEALRVTVDNGFVRVSGELDLGTVPELDKAASALDGWPAITFDLSELTFIDSTGVSGILRIIERERANDRTVVVGPMSEPVRRVLEITGLVEYLTGS